MRTIIRGQAFVLGDNVDTDQIIPAQYLSYDPTDPQERRYFGRYALTGVPESQSGLPDGHIHFVSPGAFKSSYGIVIGGKNFGCGSSREHAPLALAEAGIRLVVAEFYARIFFRNSVNGGYLLPCESTARLIDHIRTGDDLEVDVDAHVLKNLTRRGVHALKPLGDVKPIIDAGGLFAYARSAGIIRGPQREPHDVTA